MRLILRVAWADGVCFYGFESKIGGFYLRVGELVFGMTTKIGKNSVGQRLESEGSD